MQFEKVAQQENDADGLVESAEDCVAFVGESSGAAGKTEWKAHGGNLRPGPLPLFPLRLPSPSRGARGVAEGEKQTICPLKVVFASGNLLPSWMRLGTRQEPRRGQSA